MADEYKDLFLSSYELTNHFNLCLYYYKDASNIEDRLRNTKEYDIKKMTNSKSKIMFLHECEKMLKLDKFKPNEYIPNNDIIESDKIDYMNKQYKALFNRRGNTTVKTYDDVYSTYIKGVRSLCGEVGKFKKTQINKKRISILNLNNDIMTYHKQANDFRKRNKE
jgi:hypothetical protein